MREKTKFLCQPNNTTILCTPKELKNWTNGDASRRKFSTCVSVWPGLACTCVDLRSLWSRSNLHASQRKFFAVWPPNASLYASTCVHLRLCLARPKLFSLTSHETTSLSLNTVVAATLSHIARPGLKIPGFNPT